MNQDISKLPKWAKSEIEFLRMRLKEKEEVIEKLNAPVEDSKISYTLEAMGSEYGLPENTVIKFKENGMEYHISFATQNRKGIQIRAYTGTLAVSPEASNSITVKAER